MNAQLQEQNNCARLISAQMYSALSMHCLETANAFRQMYPEPMDQSIPGQIAAANRWWRIQLSLIDTSTINVRECLLDACELHDWLRLFATHVAPMIVQLGLPRQFDCTHALAV